MSNREPINIAASVHSRLLNRARQEDRPFNELLQYYAMERFLYRLSKSPHASKFILKGALLVLTWEAPLSRPTSDIDFLGITENNLPNILSIVEEICAIRVTPDGLEFDAVNVQVETITDIAEYPGVRARILAHLGLAHVTVQLDIGFGDPIVPGPEAVDYPVLLDLPAPRIRGYSRESVIAEKLESIARFGMLNSRLKDFYDIWLLASRFDFNGATLAAAIEATFTSRQRAVEAALDRQIREYAHEKARGAQWKAFCSKNRLTPDPPGLVAVAELIVRFIEPVVAKLSSGERFVGQWRAAGRWD